MGENFKVERETKEINHHEPEMAQHIDLETIGKGLREPTYNYLGSWATHIYQSEITRGIMVKTQQNLKTHIDENGILQGVTEQIAVMAFNEAQTQMKKTYRGNKK